MTRHDPEHTTLLEDERYLARDTPVRSDRAKRAYIAATLVLRNEFSLHKSIPDLKHVLSRLKFTSSTIQGIDRSFSPTSLRYDSKWLSDTMEHLVKMWCSFHRGLSNADSNVNAFDIMIWLSTLAYAESADIDVIQALAAMYRNAGFADIQVPLAMTFKLALGNSWKQSEIRSVIGKGLRDLSCSAEVRLPRQDYETERSHLERTNTLFKAN